MANVLVPDVLLAVLTASPIFAVLLVLNYLKKNAPEGLAIAKVARNKKFILVASIMDGGNTVRIAAVEKYKIGKEDIPIYNSYNGLKFDSIDPTKVIMVGGVVPTIICPPNSPEPTDIRDIMALEAFVDYLKENDHDITGHETEIIYVMDAMQHTDSIDMALLDAQVTNESQQMFIKETIDFINDHKKEISNLWPKQNDTFGLRVFTILDSMIAYTTRNLEGTVSAIETAVRHDLEHKNSDFINMGMMAFFGCLGIGVLYILVN